MPILAAEPELFPSHLFESAHARLGIEVSNGVDGPGSSRRWWCLHTKPRQEKVTAGFLRKQRIAHYLPQVVQQRRTPGGRKFTSIIPLFPGYIFLLGTDFDRLMSFQRNSVNTALEVWDQEQLDLELAQLHRIGHSGLVVVPEPSFPVGTKVRLMSGPLEGAVGTVIRRGNRNHFFAVVNMLGRGATVEFEGWDAEPLAG